MSILTRFTRNWATLPLQSATRHVRWRRQNANRALDEQTASEPMCTHRCMSFSTHENVVVGTEAAIWTHTVVYKFQYPIHHVKAYVLSSAPISSTLALVGEQAENVRIDLLEVGREISGNCTSYWYDHIDLIKLIWSFQSDQYVHILHGDPMSIIVQLNIIKSLLFNIYMLDVIISIWSYQYDHINMIISIWSLWYYHKTKLLRSI